MHDEYMSLTEAQLFLGISKIKTTKLVKEVGLELYSDPLDKRKKMLKKSEIEALRNPVRRNPTGRK